MDADDEKVPADVVGDAPMDADDEAGAVDVVDVAAGDAPMDADDEGGSKGGDDAAACEATTNSGASTRKTFSAFIFSFLGTFLRCLCR